MLEQQLAYWKPALAALPVLELPTDRPRPPTASFRGDHYSFGLGPELTRALHALSQRESATLFMTLLAAFQVLLYRYSGQEDIAIGVPIAGRTRPELERLIGFFVNTLVLRGDLSGEPSFTAYLARVRARALEAYAHPDLPFEKLVEELHPKRDLSRNPLFQVALVSRNVPAGELQLAGLTVKLLQSGSSESAKFDLSVAIDERGSELSVRAVYATDLFDRDTIERMMGHWRVLLAGIVADPTQSIARLPLLTARERRTLIEEWNATAVDTPQRCVHELFEQQVERTPEASCTDPSTVFENRDDPDVDTRTVLPSRSSTYIVEPSKTLTCPTVAPPPAPAPCPVPVRFAPVPVPVPAPKAPIAVAAGVWRFCTWTPARKPSVATSASTRASVGQCNDRRARGWWGGCRAGWGSGCVWTANGRSSRGSRRAIRWRWRARARSPT